MSVGKGENEGQREAENIEKQETIFGEMLDLSEYEKSISNTRKWLYMIAAIWFIWGIIFFNRMMEQRTAWFILGEYLLISFTFLALALWSRRRPSWAFLSAVIFYLLLTALFYYLTSISTPNLLLRIVIIISVVKGYFDARKYEELKQSIGLADEES